MRQIIRRSCKFRHRRNLKYIIMKYILLSFFIVFFAVSLRAQEPQTRRKLVVADIETRVPMRGVIVSTEDGYRDTTNWRGICYVPANFDTLTVARTNYIAERMLPKELKDTTYLIPAGKAISEVTVWGKNDLQENISRGMSDYKVIPDVSTGVLARPDFANLLDRRGRRDQKHLRNVKRRFQEMDKYDDDPIIDAYYKAMEEERIKKEQEEAEAAKGK